MGRYILILHTGPTPAILLSKLRVRNGVDTSPVCLWWDGLMGVSLFPRRLLQQGLSVTGELS